MTVQEAFVQLIAFVLLTSCASEKNEPRNDQWTSIGRAAAGDLSVELATDTRLETGLTPIHIKLMAPNGVAVTDAQIGFEPVMTMSNGKQHSCPLIGVPSVAADGIYHTAVVFQMPSSDMDTWAATVHVNESDAEVTSASFTSLNVTDSGRARTFTYQQNETSETQKFVASLNLTESPRVGLNPVVFTLHRMKDMMTFDPVDDAEIALDPQMPSMGHGSPGSVNPSPTSMGRYAGQLSFSMAGTWETSVTITRAGTTLGTTRFTTVF